MGNAVLKNIWFATLHLPIQLDVLELGRFNGSIFLQMHTICKKILKAKKILILFKIILSQSVIQVLEMKHKI